MHLTFIMYDSITNSVFFNVVLSPLIEKLNKNTNLNVTLISFEKKILSNDIIKKYIPISNRLTIIQIKRYPFFGQLSFIPSIYKLKKILNKISDGEIIARGPLAGYVTLQSTIKNIKVQARGLCAEEFRYTKKFIQENFCKKIISFFLYKNYYKIERLTYSSPRVIIEAVSSALKKYLVKTFKADKNKIIISEEEIYQPNKAQIKFFREQIRNELGIDKTAFVYCYNGSAQPWQCIEETINFFEKNLSSNNFLLILSKDINKFQTLLDKIPSTKYKLLSVLPEELNQYLSACDAGLLFRENDIINWVSRPTKLLEYQACGLKIIHNNTIAYITEKNN